MIREYNPVSDHHTTADQIIFTSTSANHYDSQVNAINAVVKASEKIRRPHHTVRYFLHPIKVSAQTRYMPIFIGVESVNFAHLGFQIVL